MKVSELLDRPEKWTKGAYARNANGKGVGELDKTACKFCLMGALWKCYLLGNLDHRGAMNRVLTVIRELGYGSIPAFNDDPKTTFRRLRRVIKKADV